MPDRYDPKGPVRRPPERRASDARVTEEDPLAELAKIVQGRPTGGAQRNRGAPAKDPGRPPGKGDAVSDLEAELLNDLQASFAAVRVAAAQPTPPEPPAPKPEPPAAKAAVTPMFPPLPDVFAPTPPAATAEPAAEAEPEPEPEIRPEPDDNPPPPRFVPIPAAPVMQPVVHRTTQAEQPASRPARTGRPPETPPEPRADVGASFQMRSTSGTPSAPPVTRPTHSRWEQPEAAKPAASDASRFAPPRGAPAPQPQPAFDDLDDSDPFADGLFAPSADGDGEGAFPLDAFPA